MFIYGSSHASDGAHTLHGHRVLSVHGAPGASAGSEQLQPSILGSLRFYWATGVNVEDCQSLPARQIWPFAANLCNLSFLSVTKAPCSLDPNS